MKSFNRLIRFLLFFVGLLDESFTWKGIYEHKGCFHRHYALVKNYQHHFPDVTLEKCLSLCSTKYAGVEKTGNYCYCGNDIAEESLKRNDNLCDEQCPDNRTAACGGDKLMSVYTISENNTRDSSRETPNTTLAPTDESHDLWYLVSDSKGVTLYNSSNLNRHNRVLEALKVHSVDYHFSMNLAFAFVKNRLYKSTLEPSLTLSNISSTLISNVSECEGFAVDWEDDRIYWANCKSDAVTIVSFDFSGYNLYTVIRRQGIPIVHHMVVDPYERVLFWTRNGMIESCQISGNNYRTNMTNPKTSVQSLSLDLTSRRVYYSSIVNQSAALHSMDYVGSDHREHIRLEELKSVHGLGVFRGYVYWVDFAKSRNTLYRAPLNFTNIEQVKVLHQVVDSLIVRHMRLVHPELQTRPVHNPCDNKGCSDNNCTVTSLTALCLCPRRLQLDNNGTTCIKTAEESKTSSTVTVVVLLAAALFLLVLVVLYIVNRYWHYIEDKFSYNMG